MIVEPIVLKKGMSDSSPNSPKRRKDSEVFEHGIQSPKKDERGFNLKIENR
jgi:hypothetical protein